MLGEGQPKSFGAETAFELPYLVTHGERNLTLDGAVVVPGASHRVIFADHHGIVVPPNVVLLATRLDPQQGHKDEFMYRGFTDGLNSGWNDAINLPETDRLPDEDPAKWAKYREWFIQYQPNGTYTMLPWQTVFTATPTGDFITYAALRAEQRLPHNSPGAPVVIRNVFSLS